MHHSEHMNREAGTSEEALELSAELATLSRQQYEALLRLPYVLMPPKQAGEYDHRRIRIAEICDALKSNRKK
jgi:hypothetical protein